MRVVAALGLPREPFLVSRFDGGAAFVYRTVAAHPVGIFGHDRCRGGSVAFAPGAPVLVQHGLNRRFLRRALIATPRSGTPQDGTQQNGHAYPAHTSSRQDANGLGWASYCADSPRVHIPLLRTFERRSPPRSVE